MSIRFLLYYYCLHSTLLLNNFYQTNAVEEWKFIVAADWHGAESFAIDPVSDENAESHSNTDYIAYRDVLTHIRDVYGGELIMLPGDANTGHWYTEEFALKLREEYNNFTGMVVKDEDVIGVAGYNCYSTMRRLFSEVGYEKVLFAPGDHELGGNPWKDGPKVDGQSTFRKTLIQEINKDKGGNYIYTTRIGNVKSRPINTPYEGTSYAHVHKNVLFITIDAFHEVSTDDSTLYHEREDNAGGEGRVTCTVTGDHLVWFESILKEAKNIPSIKHIFVQAHVPIIQPVRKMSCSGQFFDHASASDFWKTMQTYGVDLYFAGEVHANTVLKDVETNLLQITSRANRFQNFITVSVTDNGFQLISNNEVGTKGKYNAQYVEHGTLTVVKKSDTTDIQGTGVLEPLDLTNGALLSYRFEKGDRHSLKSRQVLGMKYIGYEEQLIGDTMAMRDANSTEGIINHGHFGDQYNLQIANLGEGVGIKGKTAALFNPTSEVAIYSMGPMGQGEMVSCSLYINTVESKEMVLVFYGGRFGYNSKKDIFLLTIKDGHLIFYVGDKRFVVTVTDDDGNTLNDGEWHHIALSMPSTSCLLSDVLIYIDGKRVETEVKGRDDYIFYVTSGQLSLGGWGYSSKLFGKRAIVRKNNVFSNVDKFEGMMDNFKLWGGRSVDETTLVGSEGTKNKGGILEYLDARCASSSSRSRGSSNNNNGRKKYIGVRTMKKCKTECLDESGCTAFELIRRKNGKKFRCFHWTGDVTSGRELNEARCGVVQERQTE